MLNLRAVNSTESISVSKIQEEPENYGIGRRLLDPRYNFKHERNQICSVSRSIRDNK